MTSLNSITRAASQSPTNVQIHIVNIEYVIQFLVPSLVIGLGIIITTIILIGVVICLMCYLIPKRSSENPNEAVEPSFAHQRPQTTHQFSFSYNDVYATNNRIQTNEDCIYDEPRFFTKPNNQQIQLESENRYSILNRLSHFNRNPAYNASSGIDLVQSVTV